MRKPHRPIFVLFFLFVCTTTYTQTTSDIDSLKLALRTHEEDTNKAKLLYDLSFSYQGSYPDTALFYAQQALTLSEKLNFEKGIFWSEITSGGAIAFLGNYPLALDYDFKALTLANKMNRPLELAFAKGSLSDVYYYLGDYNTSLKYEREVIQIVRHSYNTDIYFMWIQMSRIFEAFNQADSAIFYGKKAYKRIIEDHLVSAESLISPVLGNAYARSGNYDTALIFYRKGIPLALRYHTEVDLIDNFNGMAAVFKATGNADSALWYSKKVLAEKTTKSFPTALLKAADLLTTIYELKNKPDSALKYLRIATEIKDNLFNREKAIAIQNLTYKEQEKQKAIAAAELKFQNELKIYFFLMTIGSLVLTGAILWRNRRNRQFQEMRNSIADDLHDDIGSTLSSITIMSELAKVKSPEASTLLTSIGESTASMQENMSDIVWAINSANDGIENVVQRMKQFGVDILDAKGIALEFISDAAPSPRLTMKQRKNLYLFFKEVINNAAKHSQAKKVVVCISLKGHHIEVVIKDNGIGFDTHKTFDGNGMGSLRRRVEELNGVFKIDSYENDGTTVELKFKIA